MTTPTTDVREREEKEARENIERPWWAVERELGGEPSLFVPRCLDAYRTAILESERARVRAVVLDAPAVHWIADNEAVSRVELLRRLDAEPTP